MEWLKTAEVAGLLQHGLRNRIKATRRTRIIEGQAVLKVMYRVILSGTRSVSG
ncbi:MAG: hypothetical protein ABJA98_25815 [Acidobacteriota bacterium]